jgi:hypothetical protein
VDRNCPEAGRIMVELAAHYPVTLPPTHRPLTFRQPFGCTVPFTVHRMYDGPDVNHPIAIVIAGALIAAAIALTNRWTLHSQVLVRMDNWTGTTEWVNPRR